MLHLVSPDRYDISLIEKDIRRHKHGIGKQPRVYIVGVLGGFILKLGHPVQLPHVCEAIQYPCKLGVSRYMRLVIYTALFRIESRSDVEY